MPKDLLVCLSHLRWGFVYQRPQHLLTRFARDFDVHFVEEPAPEPAPAGEPRLELREQEGGGGATVTVAVPHLPEGLGEEGRVEAQRDLLDGLLAGRAGGRRPVLWYYTPMALPFTRHLEAELVVYDCMDELSAFLHAPPALLRNEADLLARADLVFTGGQSLYEAKRDRHPRVHAFPSSVDVPHFARAREPQAEPDDQATIPHPRLGFVGVIDERIDLGLVRDLAAARPDWQLVMVGPVVKIDPATLPRAPNIRYLGMKDYAGLPAYLAGWDAALMPFAINEATRFISPTKTPEYLAAGLPVVSTPVRDVVRPYGDQGLVAVAVDAAGFADAVERLLAGRGSAEEAARRARVDEFLGRLSWDRTAGEMLALMRGAMRGAAPA